MRRRACIAAGLVALAALSFAAVAPAEPLPEKRNDIPFRKELVREFDGGRWALGVVAAVGAGLGALWLVRRRIAGVLPVARTRRLKLVESLRVSPRTTVLLVEVDGRTLVLGEHAGALVLLSPAAGAAGA